jgi:hypothetical protein
LVQQFFYFGVRVEKTHPRDVTWFPPGEIHWHGAAPITGITRIAIQEQLDGKAGFFFLAKTSLLFLTLFAWEKAVDWLEKVSDEQYQT